MPANHYRRWSASDLTAIRQIAGGLHTKQAMYAHSTSIAARFGRTENSVCKKIEEINGWFWKP